MQNIGIDPNEPVTTFVLCNINWFAVLRARLSQLTMPDWLSQLGIGAASQNHHLSQHPEEQRNHQSARLRVESLPICEDPEVQFTKINP
uniref:Transposase n=1 Tax=Syphacia muris TaxID=451379 RepID=A0A0N5AQ59_9BILA